MMHNWTDDIIDHNTFWALSNEKKMQLDVGNALPVNAKIPSPFADMNFSESVVSKEH